MVPHHVIVGAGPVGLWFATQLKKRCPSHHVVILEKRESSHLDHLLHLNFGKPAWGPIAGADVTLTRSELDASLTKTAKELGIPIVLTQDIKGLEDVFVLYPDATHVYGCDGFRSDIRGPNKLEKEEVIQRALDVKYALKSSHASNKPRLLKYLTELFPILKLANRLGEEKVSQKQQADGSYRGSVRFLLNLNEFDALKRASLQGPLLLKKSEDYRDGKALLPQTIQESLNVFFNAKQLLTDDEVVSDLTLAVIPLNIYKSTWSYKEVQGRHVFLIGDSNFGVPFYKSCCNGIACANYLVDIVERCTTSVEEQKDKAVQAKSSAWLFPLSSWTPSSSSSSSSLSEAPLIYESYVLFVEQLAFKELAKAKLKARLYDYAGKLMQLHQYVPRSWQPFTFCDHKVGLIKQTAFMSLSHRLNQDMCDCGDTISSSLWTFKSKAETKEGDRESFTIAKGVWRSTMYPKELDVKGTFCLDCEFKTDADAKGLLTFTGAYRRGETIALQLPTLSLHAILFCDQTPFAASPSHKFKVLTDVNPKHTDSLGRTPPSMASPSSYFSITSAKKADRDYLLTYSVSQPADFGEIGFGLV